MTIDLEHLPRPYYTQLLSNVSTQHERTGNGVHSAEVTYFVFVHHAAENDICN